MLDWLAIWGATQDHNWLVKCVAVGELAENFKDDPDTKTFLKECAIQDKHEDVRGAAVQELAKNFKYHADLFDIYHQCAVNNPFKDSHDPPFKYNPRQIALEAIIEQFPQHPQTLPLLRDRTENDPDKQVREFAQKKLKQWEIAGKDGSDAKPYLEKQVNEALEELNKIKEDEETEE